ncbi:MAG: hypothetical protein CM15mP85_24520 [Rhodobacterales bacterium]|nr:MAG: hypothetical protein CM15mP85_24520 [Rhodobacterales bacterium]
MILKMYFLKKLKKHLEKFLEGIVLGRQKGEVVELGRLVVEKHTARCLIVWEKLIGETVAI